MRSESAEASSVDNGSDASNASNGAQQANGADAAGAGAERPGSAGRQRPLSAGSSFKRRQRQFSGADISSVRSKADLQPPRRGLRLPFKLKTLGMGCLFGGWYVFNVYFNVYNKRVLNAFPYPALCTLVHLGVGSLCMLTIWTLRLKKAPRPSTGTLLQVLPLGVLHLLGFLFTNASLGSVAVSFTHTIKALEPFFTAVFSAWLLGSIPSLISMLALVPIVSGVILASFTEASFTWAGLATALGSNFSFQLRNVLSKQYMSTKAYESQEGAIASGDALDQMNLFACITICACLLMFPCAYFLDAGRLSQAIGAAGGGGLQAVAGENVGQLALWSLMAGLCRFGDVLVSYAILAQVTPVTHSVGNCLKRVIVIAASIFIFKNPVSSKNVAGTMLAITGVFLYSMTKRIDENKLKSLPINSTIRRFSSTVLRALGLGKGSQQSQTSSRDDDDEGQGGKSPEYNL